ncbi:hypothetical protein ACFL5O_08225 [Myxococcota bacterium]
MTSDLIMGWLDRGSPVLVLNLIRTRGKYTEEQPRAASRLVKALAVAEGWPEGRQVAVDLLGLSERQRGLPEYVAAAHSNLEVARITPSYVAGPLTRRSRSGCVPDGTGKARGETLAAWRESELWASEFGRRHGISPQRLSWWRKPIGDWSGTQVIATEGTDEPRFSFVVGEVRANTAPPGAEPCSTVVRLPLGVSIEFVNAVSPGWVASPS